MAKTIMWIFYEDENDVTQNSRVKVLNPTFIPRIGEYIELPNAFGMVKNVQYNYREPGSISEYACVININIS